MLAVPSSPAWVEAVLGDFDTFLLDHAANERKASAMAMSLLAHYQDRERLCEEMIDLALEELNHFRQVYRLIQERGLTLAADEKDPYVNAIRAEVRRGKDEYFLDRLLTGAIIEARGAERFTLIAQALEEGSLKTFYRTLARSEGNHHQLFIELAHHYFAKPEVDARLADWVTIEADIISDLPIRPYLH